MTDPIDGRTKRSQRTRSAIINAVIELIESGKPHPGVADISAQANVSERSIFVHFADLEDLHRAVGSEHFRRVLRSYRPIDPGLPFDDRLRRFVAQRCRTLRAVTPFRHAALRYETGSDALRRQRARWADAARAEIQTVFATELGTPIDAARLELAAALTSWALWDELRTGARVGERRAAALVREGLRRMLQP